ncbi:hypothetical protein NKI97_34160, partial [Mesorhizobium sp. M0296]
LHSSQHLESQNRLIRNPLRFRQIRNRSSGFALWLSDRPDTPAKLGWNDVSSGNPFLKQYELPAPLRVFGRETASVVLTATGPMAVFDEVSTPGAWPDFRSNSAIPGKA